MAIDILLRLPPKIVVSRLFFVFGGFFFSRRFQGVQAISPGAIAPNHYKVSAIRLVKEKYFG